MDIRLDGKAALITGGSDGLGKAMAMKFADAGANVAILARRADMLEAARAEIDGAGPGKALCYSCDLLDAIGTADAFVAAERDLDGIDILVNNAGSHRAGPFVDISDEDWQVDFELKLFAAIRLCRLALPKMAARRWGRVINILANSAKAPPPGGAPTAVTRAAGLALTKVLAGEYASHNVLVNAMMVGAIRSSQWERLYAQEARNEPQTALSHIENRSLEGLSLGDKPI